MQPPVSAERWAAIRAICEGLPPTYKRVAKSAGLPVPLVTSRANREGWAKVDCRKAVVKAGGLVGLPAGPGSGAAEWPGAGPGIGKGWEDALAAGSDAPAEELVGRVMGVLLREVERIGASAGKAGGALDKKRLDGVWAMIRTLEKVDRLLPRLSSDRDRAEASPGQRSEDAAEALAIIEARIVELAYALADEIAEAREEGRPGGAAASRLSAAAGEERHGGGAGERAEGDGGCVEGLG